MFPLLVFCSVAYFFFPSCHARSRPLSSVRVTVCRMHFRILFFAPRHVPLIGLPPHVYSMSWSPLFFFTVYL